MQLKNITLKISAGSITFGEYKIENINFEINIPEFDDEEAKINDTSEIKNDSLTNKLVAIQALTNSANTLLGLFEKLDIHKKSDRKLAQTYIEDAKEMIKSASERAKALGIKYWENYCEKLNVKITEAENRLAQTVSEPMHD